MQSCNTQVGPHHPRSLPAAQHHVGVDVDLVLPAPLPAKKRPWLNAAGFDLTAIQPAGGTESRQSARRRLSIAHYSSTCWLAPLRAEQSWWEDSAPRGVLQLARPRASAAPRRLLNVVDDVQDVAHAARRVLHARATHPHREMMGKLGTPRAEQGGVAQGAYQNCRGCVG